MSLGVEASEWRREDRLIKWSILWWEGGGEGRGCKGEGKDSVQRIFLAILPQILEGKNLLNSFPSFFHIFKQHS